MLHDRELEQAQRGCASREASQGVVHVAFQWSTVVPRFTECDIRVEACFQNPRYARWLLACHEFTGAGRISSTFSTSCDMTFQCLRAGKTTEGRGCLQAHARSLLHLHAGHEQRVPIGAQRARDAAPATPWAAAHTCRQRCNRAQQALHDHPLKGQAARGATHQLERLQLLQQPLLSKGSH